MSLGKKILGAFVDMPDDDVAKQKLDPTKPIKPQATGQPATSIPATPIYTPTPGYTTAMTVPGGSLEDLNKFREHFKTLLENYNQTNMPGIDYYEFIQAKNMMPMPVDSQKYTITFAAQSPGGLSKQKLMDSGKQYMTVVEQELNQFLDAFDEKFKTEVHDKKQLMEQKSQQMTELSNQITALNAEIKGIQDEVLQGEATLNVKKNAFVQAANETKQTIDEELKKIDQYIQ